jgi:TonB family protein
MSEIWKRWEGQVVDHRYQLRHFLGSTDHSAVFFAEFRDPEPRKAAVKFLSADLPHSVHVLADWQTAQQLSHPNLLAIYSAGRCRIDDMDLVYAAMEYADENLSQILPHRALTPEETNEMLSVVVDVLVFLHNKKLTHGHIKPTNIVAIGDQLKLTSDTIQPLAEVREMRRERDAYDAPEIPASAYTPAADVWSLGVTLVEALTQQPAFLPFNENAEPIISPSLREPFREIATNALRRNPKARCSSMDMAVRLNPDAAEKIRASMVAAATVSAPAVQAATAGSSPAIAPMATAAPASPASSVAVAPSPPPLRPIDSTPPATPATPPVSPLSVPLSKEPAVPLAKQPATKTPEVRPPMPSPPAPRAEAKSPSRQSIVLPNYVVPLGVAILILVAFIVLPKILRRGTQSANATSPAAATAPAPVVAGNSAAAPVAPAANPAAKSTPSQPSAKLSDAPPNARAAAPSPAPAILHNSESAPVASPRKTTGSPDRGEVLDQILPRPSSAALASIQGTVRVVVRVNVDAAGNVSQATLENSGPSQYFAQKSLEAARGWVFLSPALEGRSVPSEWQIRFEFTPRGINAYPKQTKP